VALALAALATASCEGEDRAAPRPAATSPAPVTPSTGAELPAGVPGAFDGDVAAPDVPLGALVPAGTRVSASWAARTSAGDALVVAYEAPSADPFVAARGFVVWRRDRGADPPWRPVFGIEHPRRDGILGIQASIDDVTGDGSSDALLMEATGGVGNCGRWRVIDLAAGIQRWQRSLCDAEVAAGQDPPGLSITSPLFRPGDPHCCPTAIRTTVYAYRPSGRFVRVSEQTAPL
jgi:hypothetical protein